MATQRRILSHIGLLLLATKLLATSLLLLTCFQFGSNGPSPYFVSAGALNLDLNEPPPEEEEEEENLVVVTQPPPPKATSMSIFDRMKSKAVSAASMVKGKLPDYFNFDKFTASLKRSYSMSELMYRKSRFFETCMEVFRARVNFRLGKVTHLEKVNEFSDRSPNEFKRMFMSGPPIEARPEGQSVEEYLEKMKRDYTSRQNFDAELESQGDAVDRPGHKSDGSGMTIITESQVESEIDKMLAGSALDPAARAAMREEMLGEPLEMSSQSEGVYRKLPWPGKKRSADFISKEANLHDRSAYKPPNPKETIGDVIDWSEHGCFHRVYNQGNSCGMCYVMATTTAAEFYKCSEKENVVFRRQFSKEFVLDCAQKYSPTILGCMGGSILDTIRFISQAGVFSIKAWRQRRTEELRRMTSEGISFMNDEAKCPLNQFYLPFEEWGDIRVQLNPKLVHPNDWLTSLQDGPLVVSVRMPTEGVKNYAGGTHSGATCENSNYWHAMVLVGYGIDEHGTPYWRFRNSYGPNWGDQGHFNLAATVSGECLVGGVRVFREPLEDPVK